MSTFSTIAGLFLIAAGVAAEYIAEELPWSASACADAGLGEDFDVCAHLEFCEGSGAAFYDLDGGYGGWRRRSLRGNSTYASDDAADAVLLPTEGTYGWRVAGAANCLFPGPSLRLRRGVRHGLFVRNAAGEPTNFHAHGLHVAGHGNADDVMRTVRPGDAAVYNYTLPRHHMGGTFFYHAHRHGSVARQAGGGAFGALVVEDGAGVGTEDPGVRAFLANERILLLDNARGAERVYANGLPRERFELRDGEWHRLRILFVNADEYVAGASLRLGGDAACVALPVAHDGILRFEVPGDPPADGNFYLSSSSRLDVALRCEGPASSATIEADGRAVAVLEVVASPASAATPFLPGRRQWSSVRPPYLADLRALAPDARWSVDVQEVSLNEIGFDGLDTPLCDESGRDFRYDTVNEWDVRGTEAGHPLHLHMYPMQVVGGCGAGHAVGEFYDTVQAVRPEEEGVGYGEEECRVRMRFVDVGGHVILHCHVLQHEDHGAMGFFNVVGGPVQPDTPRTLECAGDTTNEACDPVVLPKSCVPDDCGGSENNDMDMNSMDMNSIDMNSMDMTSVDMNSMDIHTDMMQNSMSGEEMPVDVKMDIISGMDETSSEAIRPQETDSSPTEQTAPVDTTTPPTAKKARPIAATRAPPSPKVADAPAEDAEGPAAAAARMVSHAVVLALVSCAVVLALGTVTALLVVGGARGGGRYERVEGGEEDVDRAARGGER